MNHPHDPKRSLIHSSSIELIVLGMIAALLVVLAVPLFGGVERAPSAAVEISE